MTPYCPKCGSVRVRLAGKVGACQESDCKHTARAQAFKEHGICRHEPNQHWRDPVALSMDGYDGAGR